MSFVAGFMLIVFKSNYGKTFGVVLREARVSESFEGDGVLVGFSSQKVVENVQTRLGCGDELVNINNRIVIYKKGANEMNMSRYDEEVEDGQESSTGECLAGARTFRVDEIECY